MNDYEKLARDILNLNKMDNDFSDIKMDFITANKFSNDFYKMFFMYKRNKELETYETKIEYDISSNLNSFEGLSRLGTYKSYIDISDKESIRRVPVLMHEKAHVYEKFNHKSKNEFNLKNFDKGIYSIRFQVIITKSNKSRKTNWSRKTLIEI